MFGPLEWALLKFSPFSAMWYVYFAIKQSMVMRKREGVTKQGFSPALIIMYSILMTTLFSKALIF